MGCIIFGESQGTDVEANILEVNAVKVFDNEEEASDYGEAYLDNGGDSYMILESYESHQVKWSNNSKEEFENEST